MTPTAHRALCLLLRAELDREAAKAYPQRYLKLRDVLTALEAEPPPDELGPEWRAMVERRPRGASGRAGEGVPVGDVPGDVEPAVAASEGRETGGAEDGLIPPPEHASRYLHWLRLGDDIYEVWGWADDWFQIGGDKPWTADDMVKAGYRYLGPAEWRADDDIAALHQAVREREEIIEELATAGEAMRAGLHSILTTPGFLYPGEDAIEAVAEAWASIDSKLEQFRANKLDRSMDDTDGSYPGYMAEAEELIRQMESRGFSIIYGRLHAALSRIDGLAREGLR